MTRGSGGKGTCITNSAATQPHPNPTGTVGGPSPVQSLVLGIQIDGAQVRRGGKSLEYRNDTPRISDIYAHPKVAKAYVMHHLQSSAGSDDSFLYRKVIAEIDKRWKIELWSGGTSPCTYVPPK